MNINDKDCLVIAGFLQSNGCTIEEITSFGRNLNIKMSGSKDINELKELLRFKEFKFSDISNEYDNTITISGVDSIGVLENKIDYIYSSNAKAVLAFSRFIPYGICSGGITTIISDVTLNIIVKDNCLSIHIPINCNEEQLKAVKLGINKYLK